MGFLSNRLLVKGVVARILGYLAFDYWSTIRQSRESQQKTNPTVRRPLDPLPIATKVNEHFSKMTVAGKTYSDVTVRAVTPSTISIIHRDGSATLMLAGTAQEIQKQFSYNATTALAYEQLRTSHKQQSGELKNQQSPLPLKSIPDSTRQPIVVEMVRGIGDLVGGLFSKPPEPTPEPTPDPGIVRNRKEIIRFYERTIEGLEKLNSHYHVDSGTEESEGLSPSTPESGRTMSSSARDPHKKQIEDYRQRIARLKSEIGE